jgi:hypothetical protein
MSSRALLLQQTKPAVSLLIGLGLLLIVDAIDFIRFNDLMPSDHEPCRSSTFDLHSHSQFKSNCSVRLHMEEIPVSRIALWHVTPELRCARCGSKAVVLLHLLRLRFTSHETVSIAHLASSPSTCTLPGRHRQLKLGPRWCGQRISIRRWRANHGTAVCSNESDICSSGSYRRVDRLCTRHGKAANRSRPTDTLTINGQPLTLGMAGPGAPGGAPPRSAGPRRGPGACSPLAAGGPAPTTTSCNTSTARANSGAGVEQHSYGPLLASLTRAAHKAWENHNDD